MRFVLSPSQKLYLLQTQSTKYRLLQLPIKIVDNYIYNQNTLVTLSHKKLSVYHCTQNFKQQIINNNEEFSVGNTHFKNVYSTQFNKKIEVATFGESKIFASDKYGDVFSIAQNQLLFQNQNFAIPLFIHFERYHNKSYILLADEYSKIKIFNGSNLQELISVWVPFSCIPIQIIKINPEYLIYLTRIERKDNTNVHFELYKIWLKDLQNQEFTGQKIQINQLSSKQNLNAQLLVTRQSEFALIILKSDSVEIDYFKDTVTGIQKVYKLCYHINKGEWDFLSTAYNENDHSIIVMYGNQNELENKEEIMLENSKINEKQYLLSLKMQ